MITLVANLTGRVRRDTLLGREHLVAPLSLIVEGILAGSEGALYYPADEIAANVVAWNGLPLVVRHPYLDGKAISARNADALNSQGVGTVLNATAKDGRLTAEGWFDVDRLRKIDRSILNALQQGQKIELSTGLFTDNLPADDGAVWNGTPYKTVARNYRPDHVAILPEGQGACSLADGCGVNVNKKKPTKETAMDEADRKKIIDNLIANSCCWDAEDREGLEGMTDNQLTKVKQQTDKDTQREAVHNAAVKGFTDPGGNDHTWNEKESRWDTKAKEIEKKDEPVVNAEKPKQIKEEDLPATMREQLAFARTEMERQRDDLIGNITANLKDEDKTKVQETLKDKSLDDLRSLSLLAPPKTDVVANFAGAAGGVVDNTNTSKLTPLALPGECL